MIEDTGVRREFGEGPLSRAAALVYSLLVVELLFLLTTAPALVPLVLLDRDPSNIPLAALCVLPVGPALSAALYALHHRTADLTDLHPAAAFWRGYRANVAGALRIWIPWVAWLAILAINLANFAAAGVPGWWAVLLVLVALAVSLWGLNALVITSLFSFRTRDIVRLAAYFVGHARGVTLGHAGLLAAVVGVTVLTSEAVLALLGSVFALAVLSTSRPVTDEVRREYTG